MQALPIGLKKHDIWAALGHVFLHLQYSFSVLLWTVMFVLHLYVHNLSWFVHY